MRALLAVACSLAALPCRGAEPPGLVLDLSAAFVSATAERPNERPKPVRNCILGTSIHGTSFTRSRSRLELVPDPDRMVVDLVVAGLTWTDTVGYNGPVRVENDGTIAFEVRQRAFIDVNGVSLGEPCARAKGESELRCLSTKYRGLLDRIVKRVALKRYERQKDEAGEIADRSAEREYEKDLAADTEPQARDLRQQIEEGLARLADYGVRRDQLHVRTLADAVQVLAAVGRGDAPPACVPGADVTARAHDSAVNYLLQVRFAGRSFNQQKLDEEVAALLGRAPAPRKKKDEDSPEWAVTFDKAEPVVVRFADGQVLAKFRVTEIVIDQDVFPAMDVTARYEFRPDGDRLVVWRVGKIEAYPAGFVPGGAQKLTARQVAVRSVVEKRLNEIAARRLDVSDLTLPGDLKNVGALRLVRADARGGWLLAAWHRVTASRTAP
jgi:hypothetical protein